MGMVMVIGKIIDATRSNPGFVEDTGPTRAADGEIIDNIPDTDNSVITVTVKYKENDYQFRISRQSTFHETLKFFKEQTGFQTGVTLYQGHSNQRIDINTTPALIAMYEGDFIIAMHEEKPIIVENFFDANKVPDSSAKNLSIDPPSNTTDSPPIDLSIDDQINESND